jgi:hypothetical protein
MQKKYRRLREAAYVRGAAEYDHLLAVPTFRDFVAFYIAEGHKRCRNSVSIANSDDRIVAMATGWLRSLTDRPREYSVQYHADQDLDDLRAFWGNALDIDPAAIKVQRKSNSSQLRFRTWRCRHGVMTVRASDTYLRARLQAWIDRIRRDWALDSARRHGA